MLGLKNYQLGSGVTTKGGYQGHVPSPETYSVTKNNVQNALKHFIFAQKIP